MTTTLQIRAALLGGEEKLPRIGGWRRKLVPKKELLLLSGILNLRIARALPGGENVFALLFWLERARGWLMTCLTPLIMIIELRK